MYKFNSNAQTWGRIWKITRDLDVKLQKSLESNVGGEALDAIVWNAMFRYIKLFLKNYFATRKNIHLCIQDISLVVAHNPLGLYWDKGILISS